MKSYIFTCHRRLSFNNIGAVSLGATKLMYTYFRKLAFIGVICAGSAFGQAVNGTLLGNITDASGGAVSGAKVTITEANTGAVHNAQTNESGNYTFPDLPPGRYSVTAEAAGFKKEVQAGVDLAVNSSVRVDLRLTPGNVSESIEVTASEPPLQTDRADVGRKLETVAVANLPLGVNRNFQSLLNLVPGTTPAQFQHSQFFNAESSLQTEVNGQPRQGNSYQIEGIDDDERTGLLQILIPPAEAIQTVDVSTSNFDAELGRAVGAVTNVILKSGSEQISRRGLRVSAEQRPECARFLQRLRRPPRLQLRRRKLRRRHSRRTSSSSSATICERWTTRPTRTWRRSRPWPAAAGNLSAAPSIIYDPATGNAERHGHDPPFPTTRFPRAGSIRSPPSFWRWCRRPIRT